MEKKLKRSEAYFLNSALKDVKFNCQDQSKTISFLNLKIALSDIVEEYHNYMKSFQKNAMEQYGIKEGDNIEGEKGFKYTSAVNKSSEEYLEQQTELESSILTEEELFKSILSISENNGISTENKALLLKFLRKA